MSNYPSRFHTARLWLSAALSGAIVAAALALGLGLGLAVAEEGAAGVPPATEAAKAEAVKRIMAGREFTLSESSDPAICTPLLEAFQTQRGIEHVEPVARAERYHDPALQPYRAMCPGLEFNRWLEPIGLFKEESRKEIQAMSEDEREEFLVMASKVWFGTRDFKLYHLDFDGNPANGEEYVFYAERYYLRNRLAWPDGLRLHKLPREVDWNDILRPEDAPDDATFVRGGYTILDLARCEQGDDLQTHDPYDYLEGRPLANHTGIIRRQGRYYIFDLLESDYPPGEDVYALWIEIFNGDYFEPYCTFWQRVKAP